MEKLLLLHGAIGAKDQLEPLAKALASDFEVFTLDFNGHGKRAIDGAIYSIPRFAEDVLNFLNGQSFASIQVFGYSMGGYVGMYLARHFPERIQKLMTLGTKWHWDSATAQKEGQMLNPAKIKEKVPGFAVALAQRHGDNTWESVLNKTATMLIEMGNHPPLTAADFPEIEQPVRITLGDHDQMVSLDETIGTYKALPNAQLAILANTPHPIEKVSIRKLKAEIQDFFS